jgi:glucoamylase
MDFLHSASFSSLIPDNLSNYTSASQSIMHPINALLVLGTFALQTIFAFPGSTRVRNLELQRRSLDSFIATESPIALNNLLCNIGANGACVSGAASGIVIASPSKTNPDCMKNTLRTMEFLHHQDLD